MQRFVPSTRFIAGEGFAPIVTDTRDNSEFECTVLGEPARFYKEPIAYGAAVRNAKLSEKSGHFPTPRVYPTFEPKPIAVASVERYGNMLRPGRCVRKGDDVKSSPKGE